MCLQVVAECGIVASTGIRLPFRHDARRVCAEETSFLSVHAANEGADAEGTTTTALGISTDRSEHILSLLLLASDVVRYILYGGDFVVGHAVALRFHTGLGVISLRGWYDVHEFPGVCVETRKTECDVFVNLHQLLYGTRVLELSGCLLLHSENDAMRAHCGYNRISLSIQNRSKR
jgi:hypothetical protein